MSYKRHGLSIPLKQIIERLNKIYNTEEFRNRYGFDHYDYTLITEESYKNAHSKVLIKCNIHGTIFENSINGHLYGKGCRICGRMVKSLKRKPTNLKIDSELIKLKLPVKRIGEVDRSITKIEWQCLVCKHIWKASPNAMLNKSKSRSKTKSSGCPECKRITISKLIMISNEEFLKRANEIHDNEYEYLSEYKGTEHLIKMKHKKCQEIFYQKANLHINHRQGCPSCVEYKSEKRIRILLSRSKNIKFVGQMQFEDCINPLTKRKFKFDFCVYDLKGNIKCLIEFDGMDHFHPSEKLLKTNPKRYNIENYMYTKFKDIIKNNYCKSKNIKLIRIPYWNRNEIESIIKQFVEL